MATEKRKIRELSISELKGDYWALFIFLLLSLASAIGSYYFSLPFWAIAFWALSLIIVGPLIFYLFRLSRAKRAEAEKQAAESEQVLRDLATDIKENPYPPMIKLPSGDK